MYLNRSRDQSRFVLNNLYDHLSKNLGRNSEVLATYHADADHNKVNAYAKKVMNDPNRPKYSLTGNNCDDFANVGVAAGK